MGKKSQIFSHPWDPWFIDFRTLQELHMLVFECPFCKAKLPAPQDRAAQLFVCPACQKSQATRLPQYSAHGVLPGTRPAREDDDGDLDRDDEDRPRPRKPAGDSGAGAAAAAGMGIGMILLIVGGIAGCCLCVPAILVGLLLPAVSKVREAAARAQTTNNAKQIALACIQHQDAMRHLPSPRMQPPLPMNPAPELSWRVTILPFIEQGNMFNQFNKNQAWNGPNNQQFANNMPIVFGDVADKGQPNLSQTKFQYFTGPNTMFPDPLRKISVVEIKDGTSNTFLFAQAATPVQWSQPTDMTIGDGPLPLPADTFIAAFCDGSVRLIDRRRVDDGVLRLVINPNDGQPLPLGWENP